MKETLKSENFLPVTFCLCICFIGLLSGCGEKAGNESTDLSKDRYVKEGTEKSEEAKEKDKSCKISYPSTLNAKLMEMYEPIWKEYEYAQHYGTYCEEVWEEMSMDTYAIWRAAALAYGGNRIYYSFMDINGDGVVEMLIGKELASYMEEDITLLTVYYYDVPGKKVDNGGIVQDRSMLNLYEGGVLEIDYGEGFLTKLTYMTLWEEGWKQVEHIEERREQNIPKDAPRDADIVYLREGSGEEEREYITEEKYYAIQEEYANTPMQIEWKSFADTEGNQRMKEYFEAEALSSVIQEVTEPYTELLIGEYWNDSIYRPFIIYGNIKGKISPVIIAEEYLINLYEGGIIEVIAGKAMFEDFWYYKMKKNSAETETIVNLWTDRVDIKSDDIYYADGVEISKEEFEDMRKELTNQSLEIDWQRLEGFWQGE